MKQTDKTDRQTIWLKRRMPFQAVMILFAQKKTDKTDSQHRQTKQTDTTDRRSRQNRQTKQTDKTDKIDRQNRKTTQTDKLFGSKSVCLFKQ